MSTLRPRVIPCLTLLGSSLVKTVQFKRPAYIGDPVNTVRIFNELEVDEICFLDIRATVHGTGPDLSLLRQISDECFCPLSYGGGIHDLDMAGRILATGFEKVIINTAAQDQPQLLEQLATRFGTQAVVGAVDVQKNIWGRKAVCFRSGRQRSRIAPAAWAKQLESMGAGELLLTAVDREGSWAGLDTGVIREVAGAVRIPVVAHGGAGTTDHISEGLDAGAAAIALGSMIVYQKKGMGVLINFPDHRALSAAISRG